MAAALSLLRCNIHWPSIRVTGYMRHTYAVSAVKSVSSANLLSCAGKTPEWISVRTTFTFLSRLPAEKLWKSVTSVSPAGRKKGRARGLKKRIRDLNKGQVIGFGEKTMLWPGLNSPVIRGQEVLKQQELPPDETRKERLYELRDKIVGSRNVKLTPLERGYSGTKLPGRSLGPPDPVGDEKFEGFDSRVLEFRPVFRMTGMRGRVKSMRAFVVVGNKNGLGGYSKARSPNGMTAAHNAKNRAAKVLRSFPREDNRTVLHDFHSTFGAVTVFVFKKPEGFGLVCHRVIKSICEVVGIKDLYAKVCGGYHNPKTVTMAFFLGLIRQKPLQEFANEKRLHLVELRKDRDNYPVVVASPPQVRTEEEIDPHEVLDFDLCVHNGKVPMQRKKFQPFYINFPSYLKKMKDTERYRKNRDVKLRLVQRHGELTSFLHIREKERAKQEAAEAIEAN